MVVCLVSLALCSPVFSDPVSAELKRQSNEYLAKVPIRGKYVKPAKFKRNNVFMPHNKKVAVFSPMRTGSGR